MAGLNTGRLNRVSINLSPLAAARRGFGTLLVVGDSNVIDVGERLRSYTSLDGVAADFGSSAPEYLAAALYFGQSPRPFTLMVGRWARTATSGLLKGAVLTAEEQTLATWTAITAGAFKVTVDGTLKTVSSLNFSAVTNLNGVATAINAVLTGAVCAWDGSRFTITSSTTGAASTVAYAVSPSSGTDISAMLKLTSATATGVVDGIAAETPLECVTALADMSPAWYGVEFAASTQPTDDQAVAVAAFIEAATLTRICGWTITDTRVMDSTYTSDLASRLKALGYNRSTCQYSPNPHAVASQFGRAFSVNWNANRSAITLMYKQEPGIVAQNLTETQANTLKAKHCNVYASYDNGTAILENGVMSGGAFFDEIHGLDWLGDAGSKALWNVLYQSSTKVPQTDPGQTRLINAWASVMREAVNNGLVAPGQWNAEGFGQLETGQYLPEGFYIYSQPMAAQDQSVREQRIAPPIQIAAKLAGAIHETDTIINVNR
jgi:hypothetical protein